MCVYHDFFATRIRIRNNAWNIGRYCIHINSVKLEQGYLYGNNFLHPRLLGKLSKKYFHSKADKSAKAFSAPPP